MKCYFILKKSINFASHFKILGTPIADRSVYILYKVY